MNEIDDKTMEEWKRLILSEKLREASKLVQVCTFSFNSSYHP